MSRPSEAGITGLTAIAASLAGAGAVLAADIDAVAGAAVALNAAANGVALAFTSTDLLAASNQTSPAASSADFDVVIVGDMFYERALADLVLGFIETAVRNGCVILIGDPQRNYFPRDRFVRLADYQVPVSRELEDSEIKPTAVWRLG